MTSVFSFFSKRLTTLFHYHFYFFQLHFNNKKNIKNLISKKPILFRKREYSEKHKTKCYDFTLKIDKSNIFVSNKQSNKGKIKNTSVSELLTGWDFLWRCDSAMWPTMFIYITAPILRTFYFSYPLIWCRPQSYSFDFSFNVLYMKSIWRVLWSLLS